MTLREAYFDHLDDQGLSPNTIEGYARDLDAFVAFVGAELRAQNVRQEQIAAFVRSQRELAPATVARRLSAVRGFFRYVVREGIRPDDPTRGIAAPQQRHRLPRILSTEQVRSLLLSPDASRQVGLRHAAMLALFWASGLRVSELLRLRPNDIDRKRRLVMIHHGKGGRSRLVPIAPSALALVERYEEHARVPMEGPLFLSSCGRGFTRQGVHRMVSRYARLLGIEHVGPHRLRHAFATALLHGGANLEAIRQMMGHADLETTGRYLQLDVRELARVHAKAHPRGDTRRGPGLHKALPRRPPYVTRPRSPAMVT